MYPLLLLSMVVVLAGSFISLAVKGRKATSLVATSSLLISFLILLSASLISESLFQGNVSYVEVYSWHPFGTAGFRLDGLSVTFALIVLLVSLMASIFSSSYMDKRFKEITNARWSVYYFLLLLFSFGMLGTVLATNIVEFYIFFEVMLIPSYFLIAEFGHSNKDKASFSYFIWTHIGALLMLAGLIALAYSTRTLDIQQAARNAITLPAGIEFYIALAITLGLMVKMAGFGLHAWLPGAYTEAPAPVSALLSAAMSGIAGYGIIRLVALTLPGGFSYIAPWLVVWGLISIVYGAIMALAQDDLKLLLSYSSISQMGYMTLGIGSFTAFGIAGSVALYASNGFGKGALFMVAGIIASLISNRSMSSMGGLAKKLPSTSTFSIIAFLTMMGVPPTFGFIAEFFIFQGAFASAVIAGSYLRLTVALIALLGTILTTSYSLFAIKKIFFGQLSEQNSKLEEASLTFILPVAILCAVSLILGITPFLFNTAFSFVNSSMGGIG
ncbi:MAG: NADH-quinone oxidoreductase subunit M [Conexivisphaerales archaeon]